MKKLINKYQKGTTRNPIPYDKSKVNQDWVNNLYVEGRNGERKGKITEFTKLSPDTNEAEVLWRDSNNELHREWVTIGPDDFWITTTDNPNELQEVISSGDSRVHKLMQENPNLSYEQAKLMLAKLDYQNEVVTFPDGRQRVRSKMTPEEEVEYTKYMQDQWMKAIRGLGDYSRFTGGQIGDVNSDSYKPYYATEPEKNGYQKYEEALDKTTVKDLDKYFAAGLSLPLAAYGAGEFGPVIAKALASSPTWRATKQAFLNPYVRAALSSYLGAQTINDVRDSDDISSALDYVPFIGGINRLNRGQYTDAAFDLTFDVLTPFRTLKNSLKNIKGIGKQLSKDRKLFKTYDKLYDKISSELKNPVSEETFDKLREISRRYRNFDKALNDDKKNLIITTSKSIPKFVTPILGKGIYQQLTDNIHGARLADSAHRAGVGNAYPNEAVLDFLTGLFLGNKHSDLGIARDPGNSFFLDDYDQEKFMNNLGYFKTDDNDGVKMIQRATDELTKFRLGRKPNIYQIGRDVIPRDSVVPIPQSELPQEYISAEGRPIVPPIIINYLHDKKFGYNDDTVAQRYDLNHAGSHPVIFYRHKNPFKKEYYYRDIDLNDYGQHGNEMTDGTKYDDSQFLADIYDFVGNPFIQKTGIQKLITKQQLDSIIGSEPFEDNHYYADGGIIKSNNKLKNLRGYE